MPAGARLFVGGFLLQLHISAAVVQQSGSIHQVTLQTVAPLQVYNVSDPGNVHQMLPAMLTELPVFFIFAVLFHALQEQLICCNAVGNGHRTRLKNSRFSSGSFANAPRLQYVSVLVPGFLMPRMVIHVCSASTATIAPFG